MHSGDRARRLAKKMDVVDSDRYREAVERLRRLLYDPPPWDAPPTLHPDHALHSTHHTYNASHYTAGGGGDIEGVRVGMSLGGTPSRWLLEMLRHQEDLIAQLEKENEFLKREVVSVGEGVKAMAKENSELNRRLTESLNQAINTGEGSDTSSYNLEEMDEAIQRQMAALSRERTLLQEEVGRLEGSLAAVTKREQEALAKLNHALALAQDTHAHTAKVRASSESALEEVTNLLTVTQQEGKELKRQLADAEERLKKQEGNAEEREGQQRQRLQRLEDERDDLEQLVSQVKQQVRDGARKIADLEEDLHVAKAARLRLEAQLEEQRQHSKDAHSRLDQIIMARSGEAAAGAARARELEERLSVARQDSNRLLLTITSLAQGTGRTTELDTTDDVKSERRAAEQQLSATLAALQTKHEDEVMKLREAADQQSEAMKSLKAEVERMRQQLAEDNEKYRAERARLEQGGARVQQALDRIQEEVAREQQRARYQGGLYQQALEKLKQAEATAASAESKTAELLDIVRTTGKERDVLRQEVTFLRRIVSTSSDPTAALAMPPLEPLSPPTPPAEDAGGMLETGKEGRNQEELEVGMSAAVLANDSVFRDVTVAPGVTLLQLYNET
ncbi:myosin heavy chain, clone 203-like isoform X3 [Penaeus indicus]|uniref:myosin heavy chain, clone 203-like isoform X3 n=1 Tax=Penaeus indicus TaxID=29960 RepID=UPI00300D41E1